MALKRWRPSRATLRLRLYATLLLSDLIALVSALFAADLTINGKAFTEPTLVAAQVVVPLYVVIGAINGTYSVTTGISRRASARSAIRTLTLAIVAFLLLAFVLKVSNVFSRGTLIVAYCYGTLMVGIARYSVGRNAESLLGGNPWDTILIIDRSDDLSVPPHCNLILHADDLLDPSMHTPDMFDRLARAIGHADRVVVRCPMERRSTWAAALRGANVQGEILAPELGGLRPYGLAPGAGDPSIIVAQGPLQLFERLAKRVVDLVVAGTAIMVLAPVLLVIAACVRATSPGPVFFVQTRIGRQNRKFAMLKFRSMTVERADDGGTRSTARDDARVTSVGRLLRRTSLDELPQLFNVLKGDMSMVGPRPHALLSTAADLLFWEVDPGYWDRHAMRPGLTGLAQVRGFRGATFVQSDLERRLAADMEYIRNWSLQLDFAILMRTALVLVHRNAF